MVRRNGLVLGAMLVVAGILFTRVAPQGQVVLAAATSGALIEHAANGQLQSTLLAEPAEPAASVLVASDTPDVSDAAPMRHPLEPTSFASSPPPPPPPPPCTELSCTTKLQTLEPPWVRLDFQPRIDWRGGAVRGDCVVGEIEYILPAYCSPPGQTRRWGTRVNLPSEERLEAADVHSAHLPKSRLREVAQLLPNQTLLMVGDSVMEQFYNALQCMLRKEELEEPPDGEFLAFIKANEHLWKMGKRKMPPKLPQRARTGMRMLFSRQVNYQDTDVVATLASGNVIVINWGLHYHDMDQYRKDLHTAFALFEAHAAKPGNAVLFRETGAQHFKAQDHHGAGLLRSSSGEWERRDPSTDKHCSCAPIEDYGVNRQNGVLHEVVKSGLYPHVRVLPFYELTRPRWRWHFGNCTHRPNGWNYDTCCDCTHFCYTPGMWRAHLYDLKHALAAT